MDRNGSLTRKTGSCRSWSRPPPPPTAPPSTGETSQTNSPTLESTKTQSNARTGQLKRWRHYLHHAKEGCAWTPEENKALLSLHSAHLNHWKQIAALLPGRTGGQVKNQFFNIIRTLLRKAFKKTFKRADSLVVSEIKPKVISDIVNRTVGQIAPRDGQPSDPRTVKEYLLDFISDRLGSDTELGRPREVLTAIKRLMKDTK